VTASSAAAAAIAAKRWRTKDLARRYRRESRRGLDGFAGEVPAQVAGEFAGALVAAVGSFRERLEDDGLEVAVNLGPVRRWAGRARR
jgi:hypothetical protein